MLDAFVDDVRNTIATPFFSQQFLISGDIVSEARHHFFTVTPFFLFTVTHFFLISGDLASVDRGARVPRAHHFFVVTPFFLFTVTHFFNLRQYRQPGAWGRGARVPRAHC